MRYVPVCCHVCCRVDISLLLLYYDATRLGCMLPSVSPCCQIGSWHHGLCTQLAESVAAPVHRYIDKELQEVFTVGQMYQVSRVDVPGQSVRCARAVGQMYQVSQSDVSCQVSCTELIG